MQKQGDKSKVPVSVGKRNGLKIILDLHSNRASLGTVAEDEDVFNIFIGKASKAIQKNLLLKPIILYVLEILGNLVNFFVIIYDTFTGPLAWVFLLGHRAFAIMRILQT